MHPHTTHTHTHTHPAHTICAAHTHTPTEYAFQDEDEKRAWEEEQKQLDRLWYQSDEGHDFEQEPFNSAEFIAQKEAEVKKRMSKRQTMIQQRVWRRGENGRGKNGEEGPFALHL